MGGHGDDGEKHAGYAWLAFCVIGMVSSLTMYGIVLEYATSGNRKLHELSFVFVTTAIYSLTAFVARAIFNEKPTEISKYQMLILSFSSICSTFTSVRSLRYVIYPVQVLFKSCKPVPVMIFGVILGKKYALQKYVNVIIITTGVALFMGGGASASKGGGHGRTADTTLLGAMMLSVSLCFDGATGAYEDKLMGKDHVEPFDLMYNIQLGKAVISFCALVATNGLNELLETFNAGGMSLVLLGLTGAIGQVFVFVTISKFGALNCALIGLVRKMLSLILSFVLYGHTLNAFQTVGLTLAIAAMIANFYEKGSKKKKHPEVAGAAASETGRLLEEEDGNGEQGDGRILDRIENGTAGADDSSSSSSSSSHIELVRKSVLASTTAPPAVVDLLNAEEEPGVGASRDLLGLHAVDDLVDSITIPTAVGDVYSDLPDAKN